MNGTLPTQSQQPKITIRCADASNIRSGHYVSILQAIANDENTHVFVETENNGRIYQVSKNTVNHLQAERVRPLNQTKIQTLINLLVSLREFLGRVAHGFADTEANKMEKSFSGLDPNLPFLVIAKPSTTDPDNDSDSATSGHIETIDSDSDSDSTTINPQLTFPKGTNLQESNLHPQLKTGAFNAAILNKTNWDGVDFTSAHLEGASLIGASLSRITATPHSLQNPIPPANFRNADLSDANLHGANLPGANLSGTKLCGANFRMANLSGTNLEGADLRKTSLSGADLRHANLRGADLRGLDLRGADLRNVDLRGADLRGTKLSHANLSEARLDGADLRGLDLSYVNLRDAHLSNANLSNANLCSTNLRGANLSDAVLNKTDLNQANLEETILKTDLSLTKNLISAKNLNKAILINAILRNMVLTNVVLVGTDLTGADFSESDLSQANLSKADLSNTKLNGVNLDQANLDEAILKTNLSQVRNLKTTQNLNKANLDCANLEGVDLSDYDLTGVNLTGADLTRTILSNTNLSNASLTGAILIGTIFSNTTNVANADLSYAHVRDTSLKLAKNLYQVKSLFNADLDGIDLEDTDLSSLNFGYAKLNNAKLNRAILNNATLTHAELNQAQLNEAKLEKAKLSYANLSYAQLNDAQLSRARLIHANLSHAELNNTNFTGANLSHADLFSTDLHTATLTKALLSHTNLSRKNLSGRDLGGTILIGASLNQTDLRNSTLSNANLTNAKFLNDALLDDRTDFGYAILNGTTLREKNLNGFKFEGATLTNTDFTESSLIGTNLNKAEFNDQTNLNRAILNKTTLVGATGTEKTNGNFTAAILNGENQSGVDRIKALKESITQLNNCNNLYPPNTPPTAIASSLKSYAAAIKIKTDKILSELNDPEANLELTRKHTLPNADLRVRIDRTDNAIKVQEQALKDLEATHALNQKTLTVFLTNPLLANQQIYSSLLTRLNHQITQSTSDPTAALEIKFDDVTNRLTQGSTVTDAGARLLKLLTIPTTDLQHDMAQVALTMKFLTHSKPLIELLANPEAKWEQIEAKMDDLEKVQSTWKTQNDIGKEKFERIAQVRSSIDTLNKKSINTPLFTSTPTKASKQLTEGNKIYADAVQEKTHQIANNLSAIEKKIVSSTINTYSREDQFKNKISEIDRAIHIENQALAALDATYTASMKVAKEATRSIFTLDEHSSLFEMLIARQTNRVSTIKSAVLTRGSTASLEIKTDEVYANLVAMNRTIQDLQTSPEFTENQSAVDVLYKERFNSLSEAITNPTTNWQTIRGAMDALETAKGTLQAQIELYRTIGARTEELKNSEDPELQDFSKAISALKEDCDPAKIFLNHQEISQKTLAFTSSIKAAESIAEQMQDLKKIDASNAVRSLELKIQSILEAQVAINNQLHQLEEIDSVLRPQMMALYNSAAAQKNQLANAPSQSEELQSLTRALIDIDDQTAKLKSELNSHQNKHQELKAEKEKFEKKLGLNVPDDEERHNNDEVDDWLNS